MMTCPACAATISSNTRFCTQCGSPVEATASDAAAPAMSTATTSTAASTAATTGGRSPDHAGDHGGEPAGPASASGPTPATVVLPTSGATGARDDGDRPLDRAAEVSRELTERFQSAAFEVRLAVVGAAVTLLAFLVLPYAGARTGTVTGVAVGGRVWWQPLLAILATVLIALALRRERSARGGGDQTSLVVAVVAASVAATEAGLIGLVSGPIPNRRIGYYVILLGTVLVLTATILVTRRCDRPGPWRDR